MFEDGFDGVSADLVGELDWVAPDLACLNRLPALRHGVESNDFHLAQLAGLLEREDGNIILAKAREVLHTEFPELAGQIAVHLPDEKNRRVGQAVAAASLPAIKR